MISSQGSGFQITRAFDGSKQPLAPDLSVFLYGVFVWNFDKGSFVYFFHCGLLLLKRPPFHRSKPVRCVVPVGNNADFFLLFFPSVVSREAPLTSANGGMAEGSKALRDSPPLLPIIISANRIEFCA